MQQWLIDHGQQKFRAKQIFEWLYQKRVNTIDEMTNLSKELRQILKDHFAMTTLTTVVKQESKDGTIKFLFELQDGYTIETVLMRHEYGNSVCVTTQVGCRIGCTFCASTLGGLKRNLEAGEIVSQVLMTINRAYNVDKLMEAIRYYQEKTNRRVTFEYGLFGGVNDQLEHARDLAHLIKNLNCHVNLIPVNHVPERNYVKTPKDDIFKFEKELKRLGINATIRREQGSDIDAACGQLRAKERQVETR